MGHYPGNDDLIDGIPQTPNTYSRTDYYGGQTWGEHGEMIDENGRYIPGTSSAEQDVRRYRTMAYGQQGNPYARIDRNEANAARGEQMKGLGYAGYAAAGDSADMRALRAGADGNTRDMQLLREGAEGTTPSRAEMLGNRMADRSLQAQVSAAGNVRGGPGAQAAAYRYAAQNAASQRADMAQGIQAERAAELANARNAYSGAMGAARKDYATASGIARGAYTDAAHGVRGQDAGIATDQAKLEAGQRAENMAQERFYEQQAFNTRAADLAARQASQTGDTNQRNIDRQMYNAEDAANWGKTKDMISMGAGAVSGGLDAYTKVAGKRAEGGPVKAGHPYVVGERGPEVIVDKEPIIWGSLAPITWGAKQKAGDTDREDDKGEGSPAWLDAYMGRPRDTTGSYAGGIYRDFPEDKDNDYYRDGIVKANPYRADGGPVEAQKPYVVGERGPEVIVPKRDGVVIPNEAVQDLGDVEDWERPGKTVRGPQGEDYGHRTLQSSMDQALAEKEAERAAMKRDERNTAKTIKRDTPEDRKRDLGAYYKRIAEQADAQMAAWQQDKGRASVALNEGDVDNESGGKTLVAGVPKKKRGGS